ncbi:hypothetical protein GT755_11245 [Herbidospora sp. NEAU-GS84]|uniref:PIN domain-containing protein n=1 Tax=Herbidospora solisilvae TaxID=2696284 RepID=A0A7C9NGA9_9ACTN|nr:hypothetical protein [Herbidospora solisilvae]
MKRLDLLRDILRGRGRWTEAIEYEAHRSAQFYPDLHTLISDGWLGEAIEVSDPQAVFRINRIRTAAFGGSHDEPTKHLGEAQTCYVIKSFPEFRHSYWITDDRDAAEYARAQGITTKDTRRLISDGVQDGACTADEGFRLLGEMRALGRSVDVPGDLADL